VVVRRIDASLPSDQNERSVWLSEHVDPEDSKFPDQTTRHWQRDYDCFSEALLGKAMAAGLDAESLSKVLKAVQADAGSEFLAHLPIAAYASRLNDEPVWIVVIHWEQCLPLPPEYRMPPPTAKPPSDLCVHPTRPQVDCRCIMQVAANNRMQRMRASRSAQSQFLRQRRLARTADASRSA
jgi:hypothetical protein